MEEDDDDDDDDDGISTFESILHSVQTAPSTDCLLFENNYSIKSA
jgi:hypothetical protein